MVQSEPDGSARARRPRASGATESGRRGRARPAQLVTFRNGSTRQLFTSPAGWYGSSATNSSAAA
jgi:hypothetical protein